MVTQINEQTFANSFDERLASLITEANARGADWEGIARKISIVRPYVRAKMSEADQRATL